jgi:hypothetical protein
MRSNKLIDMAKAIEAASGHYTGGPSQSFEEVGRDAFCLLLSQGLLPSHKLLDFGCGSLRIGYWLIRFLDSDCYSGIEPKSTGVRAGLEFAIGKELEEFKRPQFSFRGDNKMGVFETEFDYVHARSILTHTAPGMLASILNSFRETCPHGTLIASYWREDSDLYFHTNPRRENGIEAVGDHLSSDDMRFIAVVRYTFHYMRQAASDAGLSVVEIDQGPINKQIWLKFSPIAENEKTIIS